jgi:hypothetical protein
MGKLPQLTAPKTLQPALADWGTRMFPTSRIARLVRAAHLQ